MKIYTRIEIDMETGIVIDSDNADYDGPVAECCGGGGGGGGGDGNPGQTGGMSSGSAPGQGSFGGQGGLEGGSGDFGGGGGTSGMSGIEAFEANRGQSNLGMPAASLSSMGDQNAAIAAATAGAIGALTAAQMATQTNFNASGQGAIHGPDRQRRTEPKARKPALKPAVAKKVKTTPTEPEKKIIAEKKAARPHGGRTIATSPLGITTPPSIRRKTLLGQ